MTGLPTLKVGSKSEAVKGLKNALMTRAEDFDLFDRPLSEDFGPKTDRAVKSFQHVAGLDADGIVGPLTWEALVVHGVAAGETLSSIADHTLGDSNSWTEIFKLNGDLIDDPDKIFPGQVLTLPIHGC